MVWGRSSMVRASPCHGEGCGFESRRSRMEFSNAKVAHLLHDIATAYTIKKLNFFQIRAYENAADAIEHSSSEIKDLWETNQLNRVPGIGESLKSHLDELFKTGKVKHWITAKEGIPKGVFEFLDIPGIGPQTALKLSKAGVKDLSDLEYKLKDGVLLKKGFSEKQVERLNIGFQEAKTLKTGRMLLPYAFEQAQKIIDYLKKDSNIEKADVLGSLRRMVATIGDLDFSIASNNPEKVIEHIIKMPGIVEIVEKGETKATVVISSGLHVDFLITKPDSYGALLQHFTGSKLHNIHLRTIAEKKGLSLSEHGVKKVKNEEIIPCESEEELYRLMGTETPPPEIREDTGEIEAGMAHKLPKLIELKDIKGDLHLHSNFQIQPSHDLGANTIKEIAGKGKSLGYQYIGLSEHQPSQANHTEKQIIELILKKKELIEQQNYSDKSIRVLNLLELDIMPDGSISVPEEALKLLDFAIAGVHSAHHQSKDEMTKRLIKALENPYVKVLTHPTGRLLNERNSSDANWEEVFKTAVKYNKAMEINSFPNRLDLPDNLVRIAKELGVKFMIDTDSHEISQMEMMKFGVAVARRGWLTKDDVINCWDWKKFEPWCNIKS